MVSMARIRQNNRQPPPLMEHLALFVQTPVAAVGYSLIYLLFGGGIFGALVIFVIAKMLGK